MLCFLNAPRGETGHEFVLYLREDYGDDDDDDDGSNDHGNNNKMKKNNNTYIPYSGSRTRYICDVKVKLSLCHAIKAYWGVKV